MFSCIAHKNHTEKLVNEPNQYATYIYNLHMCLPLLQIND